MDDVGCTASETRLIDCPFSLNHNCRHSEDAGVRCTASSTGILKLVIWYAHLVIIMPLGLPWFS